MNADTKVEITTVSKEGVEATTSFDLTKEAVIRVPTRTIFVASHPLSNILTGMTGAIPARYLRESMDQERWYVYVPIDRAKPSTKIYFNPAIKRDSFFPFTFFKGKMKDGQTRTDEEISKVVKYLVLTDFGKDKIAQLAGKDLKWVEVMCSLGVSIVKKTNPPKPKLKDRRWVQTKETIIVPEGPSFNDDDFKPRYRGYEGLHN